MRCNCDALFFFMVLTIHATEPYQSEVLGKRLHLNFQIDSYPPSAIRYYIHVLYPCKEYNKHL